MKTSLIRLPKWAELEVNKYCEEKGLPFATGVRCIVIEYLTARNIGVPITIEQAKYIEQERRKAI